MFRGLESVFHAVERGRDMPTDRDVWSIGCGGLGGIRIRVHLFLVVAVLAGAFVAWNLSQRNESAPVGWFLIGLTVYFASLLIHEFAHLLAASRLGGETDLIVLGPLGGMRPIRIPEDPHSELVVQFAGPMSSLFLGLMCLAGAGMFHAISAGDFLRPLSQGIPELSPGENSVSSWEGALRIGAWFNVWMAICNLIPAFPFDAGRGLSLLLLMYRAPMDRSRAQSIVGLVSRIVVVVLLVVTLVAQRSTTGEWFPPWLASSSLAVFIFFSARREEAWADKEAGDAELFGYDFSEGYTSLDRGPALRRRTGLIARMFREIRHRIHQRRLRIQFEEERELDLILQKLHVEGRGSLTPAEHHLLRRASARYRRDSRAEKS